MEGCPSICRCGVTVDGQPPAAAPRAIWLEGCEMIRKPLRTHIETLGAEELEYLWGSYVVSRAEWIRNRLLVHYLPLARGIARHVHSRLPSGPDFEDLAQAAALGMRDAIATFRPEHGIKFERLLRKAGARGARFRFSAGLQGSGAPDAAVPDGEGERDVDADGDADRVFAER